MIDQTRLLTLQAAHALDTGGVRAARKQVKTGERCHLMVVGTFHWLVFRVVRTVGLTDCSSSIDLFSCRSVGLGWGGGGFTHLFPAIFVMCEIVIFFVFVHGP